MNDDMALLTDYAVRGTEAAFETLVSRYVNLVYSAALRQVNDRQRAEEVTQTAFILLARKASSLGPGTILPSWLYRTASHAALDVSKKERRRERREKETQTIMNQADEDPWQLIAPLLDSAIAGLNEKDRHAIVLRFFENQSLQQVGQMLGTSEDAAKMRVNRAVEKLRTFFARRGAAIPAAALTAAISAHAVQAAPGYLALSVVSAAKAAAAGGTTLTLIKIMTMAKVKLAVIGAVAVVGVATPLVLQHRAQAKLREENESLRQQVEQQAQLAAENERLSALIAQTAESNSQAVPKDQLSELLRLRAEVARLRTDSQEVARLKIVQAHSPVDDLRQKLNQMPDKAIPELQLLDEKKWAEDVSKGKLDTEDGVRQVMGNLRRAAKISFVSELRKALNDYLRASGGQLPNDLAELKPFFKKPVDDAALQRYALLHVGKVSDVPGTEPLVGEKAAVDDQYDTLFKISASGCTMEGVGRWIGMGFTNKTF
jgi:RNA polymerase sigma factor (sigma-70 family)